MGRRSNGGPPISLFSFQDIITSVTAIIILMTLLLALELLSRKFGSAAEVTAASGDRNAELKRQIVELQERRDRLANELRESTQLVETAAENSTEQLRDDIEATKQQVNRLERELELQAAELQDARIDDKRAKRERDAIDSKELAELRRRIASNEHKLAELRSSNALIFRPAADSGKRTWLVDILADRIAVEPLGDPGARVVFDQSSLFRMGKFTGWLRSLRGEKEYFLLLLRPSGIEQFRAIRSQFDMQQFDIGFDLIGEQQRISQAAEAAP
jgi:hypothetical protein